MGNLTKDATPKRGWRKSGLELSNTPTECRTYRDRLHHNIVVEVLKAKFTAYLAMRSIEEIGARASTDSTSIRSIENRGNDVGGGHRNIFDIGFGFDSRKSAKNKFFEY